MQSRMAGRTLSTRSERQIAQPESTIRLNKQIRSSDSIRFQPDAPHADVFAFQASLTQSEPATFAI